MVAIAEEHLAELFNHIIQENERVLAQFRKECPFDKLSSSKQGSIYAGRIGRTPLASFLHRARKRKLTLEQLRNRFKKLRDVVKFVRRIGLLHQNKDNK